MNGGWRAVTAAALKHGKPTSGDAAIRPIHVGPRVLRANGWRFYAFLGETGVRFMCAWDTPAAAVDHLAADIRRALAIDPPPAQPGGPPPAPR